MSARAEKTGPGVTVVVTRWIRPGSEGEFERLSREFAEASRGQAGYRGTQVLRPVEGEQAGEYTLIVHFDSLEGRRAFKASAFYAEWMARFALHSMGEPVVRELRHLEGWEVLSGQAGPRWKMALVVWAGVFVTSQLLYAALAPWSAHWPRLLLGALVSGAVVAILTWLVLPVVTRWLRGWLQR